MRVAIYIRVSTQEQADEGYSLGAQTERLSAYCHARDWTIHQIYTDGGYSGSNTSRPALAKLLSDIQKNKIDLVLVYKLDRLSRSQKDTLYLIEDVFLKNNVEFVSMNENFDTSTAFGRAMIGILSVFSQLEREQIKERTSMGRIERAKDGYFHGGGFAPIGYDYIDGHLIINEYEAMQVREVYDLFLKGLPISRIQIMMQNKEYTTKHGGWNSYTTVRSTLTQIIYTGKIKYKDEIYEGRHEAIIDEATFNKSLARYEAIRWNKGDGEHKKRPFQSTTILGGLMFCGNCGARYFAKGNYSGRGENKRYHPYYTCYSRAKSAKNMIIDPDCRNKSYAVTSLDNLIKSQIKKLTFDPDFLTEVQEARPSHQETIAALELRITEIDSQISRILDLYQLGTLPLEKLNERIDSLNTEKESIIEQIDGTDVVQPALTMDEAQLLLKTAHHVLDHGELSEQRELVHALIDHIDLIDEDVVIHWAFI